MPYPVSDRFRETVAGSHRAIVRCTLLHSLQFGVTPRATAPAGTWWDLPLHDEGGTSDVTLPARGHGTASLTVPGAWWDLVQPLGAEVFIERGVVFSQTESELVPLGYFRIDRPHQDDQPSGPIALDLFARTAQLAGVRIALPWQVPAGTSHRAIFVRLVSGSADAIGGYGMYGPGVLVPVRWEAAGYNPDTTVTSKDVTVEDSAYDFLTKLVAEHGCVIRATPAGEIAVVALDRPPATTADVTLMQGRTGTLVKASRTTDRAGVFNVVRATGSDVAFPTGHRFAYITDPASPIRWNGPFGPVLRYYASPLLKDAEAAEGAATTILSGSTGLPTEQTVWTVPDPSLQSLDLAEVVLASGIGTHVIDEVTVPLTGSSPVEVRTRTRNVVPENPQDPEPDPGTIPDPGTDPGTVPDPGTGTPGGGDPSDGVQAAVLNGWGSLIDGDEFVTAGDLSRWGLYNGAGHDGNGLRRPSAFTVHDGMMTIHGSDNDVSGGTAFKHRSPGRGYRVECRMRVYKTADDGGDHYHPVLILWPDSDDWPAGAEYDFAEMDEGDSDFGLFMHLPNHTPYRQDHYSEKLDITQWHNYAVDWNARDRKLTAYIDGRKVYEGLGRVADAPGPMHLTVQLDHFGGNPRSANMDVSFVRVYNRVGA